MDKALLDTLLEELCKINGTSGREEKVREYILDRISDKCRCTVTPLGCVIAEYTGRKTAAKKLMVSAHMDEVALIVTDINEDGTLKIDSVGGVSADAVIGRAIVHESGISGVIGTKAIHNMSEDERKKPAEMGSLYADIGAQDKADALKYVQKGDILYYKDGFTVSPDGYVTSKAIDDRAGVAIMLAMILSGEIEYDTVFTFVTQEEIGLRGAKTAAYTVDPELAIVLEATTAADVPLSQGAARCCEVGKGAVVSFMDRSTMYDRALFELSKKKAAENGILWQTKSVVAGGNDSGAIHISRGGVRTIAISAPTRYLHTPSCTTKLSDIHECYRLCAAMMPVMAEGNF